MKKGLLLLLILLQIGASSCTWLMMKAYGVKNPKIENQKSIIRKLKKLSMDTCHLLILKSTAYAEYIKAGIPEGEIYDARGRFIQYKKTDTSCNAGLFSYIEELDRSKVYAFDSNKTAKRELRKFLRLNGDTVTTDFLKPADFYVFVSWAAWIGRLNKDHVRDWEILAKKNPNAKIQFIKVNVDIQEIWPEEFKQKIRSSFKKKKKN